MLHRDPETRANSEARTNGTTVAASLSNVKDAEEPEEEEVNIQWLERLNENIWEIWHDTIAQHKKRGKHTLITENWPNIAGGRPQDEWKLQSEQFEAFADEGFERTEARKQQQRPRGETRAVRLIWFSLASDLISFARSDILLPNNSTIWRKAGSPSSAFQIAWGLVRATFSISRKPTGP